MGVAPRFRAFFNFVAVPSLLQALSAHETLASLVNLLGKFAGGEERPCTA